jgi:hypothetical protein
VTVTQAVTFSVQLGIVLTVPLVAELILQKGVVSAMLQMVRVFCTGARQPRLRVRVEIMGSQECRNAGESQSVLIMNDPIIFTRTRTARPSGGRERGSADAGRHALPPWHSHFFVLAG